MPVLINSNLKRYYNNDLLSCAGLFTLCIIVLTVVLPALVVIYLRGKYYIFKIIFRFMERNFLLL